MFRRTLFLLRTSSLVPKVDCLHPTITCRTYTTSTSLLTEINLKMARVLNEASTGAHGSRATLHKILQLAQELRISKEPFNNETFEYIYSAYAKGGKDQFQMLYKSMLSQHIRPSRNFFHQALQLAALSGDATTQARVLHHMKEAGHKPTSKTYHLMFVCMRENSELERALDTLDEMKSRNIQPGLLSYLTLIDLAVHFQQPKIASDLLTEAEKLTAFKENHHQFVYMQVLRSAACNGLYQITKLNWKRAVIDRNIKPDEGLCLHVLNLAGQHGDPTLAGDVIQVLSEEGYTYRECHFLPLIEAFASTGDIANTFQVFTAMRKVGVIPNKKTASPIAFKLGKDKNAIRKARDVLQQLAEEGKEVDVAVFNLIIHSLAYNGEYDDAISVYGQAQRMKVKMNSETLDAALDACIHCKDGELGQSIYQEQLSNGIKATATTLSKMVTLMCTQEDYEVAFKYLETMKRKNLIPLRGCYFKLVKTLAAHNDPRLDIAIADMRAYGYNTSNFMDEYIKNEEQKRLDAKEEETEEVVHKSKIELHV